MRKEFNSVVGKMIHLGFLSPPTHWDCYVSPASYNIKPRLRTAGPEQWLSSAEPGQKQQDLLGACEKWEFSGPSQTH